MVFDVVVFGDMEFLGGFLSFPLGGFHAKTFLKPNYYYYWSSATILVYRPTFLLSPTLQISLPLKKLYFFLLKLHVGGRGKIISTFLLPSALWPPTKYLFIVKHTLTYTSHSIFKTEILFFKVLNMFLFKEPWHKYCNKNILYSDEYRDLFQPHGTVKHCISKILSGIFSTWSESVRTFMFFPWQILHLLVLSGFFDSFYWGSLKWFKIKQ